MLDSGSSGVEDWSEEIFTKGVGVKWKKWARGRGRKNIFSPPQLPPILYRSSIQLQSKMVASKPFI